jgi:hypothetical protein
VAEHNDFLALLRAADAELAAVAPRPELEAQIQAELRGDRRKAPRAHRNAQVARKSADRPPGSGFVFAFAALAAFAVFAALATFATLATSGASSILTAARGFFTQPAASVASGTTMPRRLRFTILADDTSPQCIVEHALSELKLGAACRLRLDAPALVIETSEPTRIRQEGDAVRLLRGLATFKVDPVRAPLASPVRVLVEGGSIEVLGTTFVVQQDSAGGYVRLIEGKIRFIDRNGSPTEILPGGRYDWLTNVRRVEPRHATPDQAAPGPLPPDPNRPVTPRPTAPDSSSPFNGRTEDPTAPDLRDPPSPPSLPSDGAPPGPPAAAPAVQSPGAPGGVVIAPVPQPTIAERSPFDDHRAATPRPDPASRPTSTAPPENPAPPPASPPPPEASCVPAEVWKSKAYASCESQGLTLSDIVYFEDCGNGSYKNSDWKCAKPPGSEQSSEQPNDICVSGVLGDGSVCEEDPFWKDMAYSVCLQQKLELYDLALAYDCAGSLSSYGKYLCCTPEPPEPTPSPGDCSAFEVGGAGGCASVDALMQQASKQCEVQGLTIMEFTVIEKCPSGASHAKFLCCAP